MQNAVYVDDGSGFPMPRTPEEFAAMIEAGLLKPIGELNLNDIRSRSINDDGGCSSSSGGNQVAHVEQADRVEQVQPVEEPKIVEIADETNGKVDIENCKVESKVEDISDRDTSYAEDFGFEYNPATIKARMPKVFVNKLGMKEVVTFTCDRGEESFTAYHEFTRAQFLDAFDDIMLYIRTKSRKDEHGNSENPFITYDLSVYNDNARVIISDKEVFYAFLIPNPETSDSDNSDNDGLCGSCGIELNNSEDSSDSDPEDSDSIFLIDATDEWIKQIVTREEFNSNDTFYGFEMIHRYGCYDYVPMGNEHKCTF